MDYTILTYNGVSMMIRRNSDKAYIPINANNPDYQAYLVWDETNDADTEGS